MFVKSDGDLWLVTFGIWKSGRAEKQTVPSEAGKEF